MLNDNIIYLMIVIHHHSGSEKSLVVPLVVQELDHLFVGELRSLLGEGSQVLELLVAGGIDWSLGLVRVVGQV